MIIISGVNVFPSDIETVVRSHAALTGEYRITVYEEERLLRFDVEVETVHGREHEGETLAKRVEADIKLRSGVRPKRVHAHPAGTLPRTTHKAKRLVDLRIKEGVAP